MRSLWNDRLARIAALVIVCGIFIELAFEASTVASGIVGILGLGWTAAAALGLVVVVVALLFPGWWPLWRARRARLSNPWVFAMVSWGFATASLQVVVAVVVLPLTGFQVYFAPQLESDGALSADAWRYMRYASEYWWVALPLLQVFATVWVTRALTSPWPAINRAMSSGQDSSLDR